MRWKFWWNENFEPPTAIVLLAEYEENGWRICGVVAYANKPKHEIINRTDYYNQ